MKMNNGEAYLGYLALQEIIRQDVQIPIKGSYAITKNRYNLQQALKPYSECRDKIINEYSNGTGQIDINESPEAYKNAYHDIAEIDAKEIEVDVEKVAIKDLGDINITPKMMSALMFMITD